MIPSLEALFQTLCKIRYNICWSHRLLVRGCISTLCFDQLKSKPFSTSVSAASDNFVDEVQKLVDEDHAHRLHTRNLESDLNVYKNAYARVEEECQRLSRVKFECEKQAAELQGCNEEVLRQNEDLKLQLKVRHCIVSGYPPLILFRRAIALLFSLMETVLSSKTNSSLKGRQADILPQSSYQSQSLNTSHKPTAHINIKSEFTFS